MEESNQSVPKEGKHNCQECGKHFSRTDSVTRHQKSTHIGIQYPNDECEYKATRKSHLASHQTVHMGRKQTCTECGQQFTLKRSLILHQKSIHKD